ncbi:MAG: cyclic nucleotide-binding domain-containing protein, partial [Candidatus Neomarinimicrobiota bacterium]
ITILEEGDCIGEMALLDQEPRSAGALAIVDSILLKIDQEGFYELMSTNPEIMKQIVMILTQRVREMNKKVTSSL